MRLHGRNAEQWWTHDHPDDRYNYLYSPGEIDGFADTVATVRRLVQKIYVYLNNHFAGKAVANAATLRHRLGQPVPGEYPARCSHAIRSWTRGWRARARAGCSTRRGRAGDGSGRSRTQPQRTQSREKAEWPMVIGRGASCLRRPLD